ncbi:probable pectinesterase/pectinesterase inhibitor 46 [Ipomoea triloba]|uniref:probable pectinesterase/pectinesterase inhibitor 46 n=1 Tax=Ipomoea triloba TaxID=35885 RepID=UPI00125DD680|nr:probable pectinesterase/pectinesterase inhibitor 46 [Ipomoea triloba]
MAATPPNKTARLSIIIIGLSCVVLVACVVGVAVGVSQTQNGKSKPSGVQNLSATLKAICDATLYPDSCYTTLGPAATSDNLRPQDIYKLSVRIAVAELSRASDAFFNGNSFRKISDPMAARALETCRELLALSMENLNDSMATPEKKLFRSFSDFKTWLSSAGTNIETCADTFTNTTHELSTMVLKNLKNSSEFTSNSLAILSVVEKSIEYSMESAAGILGSVGKRRLMNLDVPTWLSGHDRRLLQSSSWGLKIDAVVAKDGSGKYKTIKDALNAVPDKSDKRFVIYVKKGVYLENVKVEKSKWNVMMIGDGKDATVVSGNLNFVDGTPTFQTATFAVFGKGFIARDMGFRNTAGAAKHQAVALMSAADLSVFFRCKMDAFQDTLYAHSNRQFYRDCDISGTVDFIFGNSAAVFQNCNILPRKPLPGQQNTITAQGKTDPNQNTGISIHNCTVSAAEDLAGVATFLGRPWKNYSTTVVMRSVMGSLVDPKGWLPWVGDSAPDTIFYGEFQNFGPGAVTGGRVKWKGLKVNITSQIASKFSVKQFIQGDKWIPATGARFKPDI